MNLKKTAIIWTILTITIISIIFIFLHFRPQLTGEVIEEDNTTHSWTKAICNESYCQDYEIICKGEELIKMTPITGRIFHSEDWKDSRDEELQERICEKYQ